MAVTKKAKKTVKKAAKSAVKKTAAKKTAAKKTAKKAAKRSVTKAAATRATAKSALTAAAKNRRAELSKRKDMLTKILFKKRGEVVEGLEARMHEKLTRETGQKIDSAMDSADQSAQDVDQGIDYSLLEMKYEQYKDIADAFRKLQSDSYGLCEECGNEISVKRLEVSPFARYCIECKTRKEEIEKIQKEETRFKE
jgi:DnaK suppressor protein